MLGTTTHVSVPLGSKSNGVALAGVMPTRNASGTAVSAMTRALRCMKDFCNVRETTRYFSSVGLLAAMNHSLAALDAIRIRTSLWRIQFSEFTQRSTLAVSSAARLCSCISSGNIMWEIDDIDICSN